MRYARHLRPFLGLLLLATGCSQPGSFLSSRTSVGSLKASVSHLDFENQKLRRELATLQSENRQVENRLTQEEATNGDLSARLDDAKELLRRLGMDVGTVANDTTSATSSPSVPAIRSNRAKRKPPVARIPGRIDPLDSSVGTDDQAFNQRLDLPSAVGEGTQVRSRPRWLPVAQGLNEGPAAR